MEQYSKYAPVIVRLGMSLVFLCFSINQFLNPSVWTGFVPDFVTHIFGGNALLVVLINAWFELVFGLLLLAGFETRIVGLLLSLHLVIIAGSIGWSPLGIRDYGLAIATLSVFVAGADAWTADRLLARHSRLPGDSLSNPQ